jgi:hypothetical protein
MLIISLIKTQLLSHHKLNFRLLKFGIVNVLLILVVSQGFSQSAEVGIFLGATSYKGELSNSLFNPKFMKPALGILYRKNLNGHWAYRLGLNYGTIIGDDAKSEIEYNQNRNLSFRSSVWDLHYYLEFNFFKYQIVDPNARFTPFLFVGINAYLFNPKGEINGDWYNLQPLGTEGQGTAAYPDRDPYHRLQIGIPFGGGVKFKISNRLGMTIEAGPRRTYTDYLDDVSTTYADKDVLLAEHGEYAVLLSDKSIDGQSIGNTDRQRGNASDNDWFMFTGITINYAISKKYNNNCTPFKGKLK